MSVCGVDLRLFTAAIELGYHGFIVFIFSEQICKTMNVSTSFCFYAAKICLNFLYNSLQNNQNSNSGELLNINLTKLLLFDKGKICDKTDKKLFLQMKNDRVLIAVFKGKLMIF